MKQNFKIEIIVNPEASVYSGVRKIHKSAELRWLRLIMLPLLSNVQPIFETSYLDSLGKITKYCLS